MIDSDKAGADQVQFLVLKQQCASNIHSSRLLTKDFHFWFHLMRYADQLYG